MVQNNTPVQNKPTQTVQLTQKMLGHMRRMMRGRQHGSVLLTGEPGTGKTSYAKIFASLMGLKIIIIEIPHITEEHMINIPFITFNPQTNISTPGRDREPLEPGHEDKSSRYNLILAQSSLYAQITSGDNMSDQQYIEHIKKSPLYIQSMFKAMGGNEKTIPSEIKSVREHYKSILFLDEYYRQTSTRIRNILRDILNKRIGMHQIPSYVYMIYASNMKDTGLDEIHSNAQFEQIKFKAPSKEEWFDWFISEYENNDEVKLDKQVIEKFREDLEDQDISHTDIDTAVRTSPRRWEQILLYINTSLPVSSKKEAQVLLANIKNNFVHYQDETYSKLSEKVLKATAQLIKQTSNIDIAPEDADQSENWRDQLEHLVNAQMKLGKHRKHIPVISGRPGIGKTYQAATVAKQHNLRLINIDVGPMNVDDVIGIPLPAEGEHANDMNIQFAVPALYQKIIKLIKEQNEAYVGMLDKKYGADAPKHIDQYKKQKYKYLIFFDEINRTDEKVFNALRRVILEKNFGPGFIQKDSGKNLELPEGSICIAAMNPGRDEQGTSELTGHFRDAIDVIPSSANWETTREYMMADDFPGINKDVPPVALNVIDHLVKQFKTQDTKYNRNQQPFYLEVGAPIYISPREYLDMFENLVDELNTTVRQVLSDPDVDENEIREYIDEAAIDSIENSLSFPFSKHGLDEEEFIAQLDKWVKNLEPSVFGGLLQKKIRHVETLAQTLGSYLDGKNIVDMPENVLITNLMDTVDTGEIVQEMKDVMHHKITDEESIKKYLLDENQPQVIIKGTDLSTDPSTKTNCIYNTIIALLYTLHIHKYSNDRVMAMRSGMAIAASEVINKLIKSGKIGKETATAANEQMLGLRGVITRATRGLQTPTT